MGVYTAAGCGALWGLLVFPRLIARQDRALPIAVRIALPVLMFGGGAYWLVRPLLPDPGLTNAKIEIVRGDDEGTKLSELDLSYVGSSITEKAAVSGKYVSIDRMEFTTNNRYQVRVLMIIDDAEPVAHRFLLPRSGDAVYRQSHGVWKEERTEARESKLSVELRPWNTNGASLQTSGPCCYKMAQSSPPYR
jgi:hypothetical protein